MHTYYSEYIEINKMNITKSVAIIRVLSEMFVSHGVCNTFFSSEEFKKNSRKFKHVTSDPTDPQSNGFD